MLCKGAMFLIRGAVVINIFALMCGLTRGGAFSSIYSIRLKVVSGSERDNKMNYTHHFEFNKTLFCTVSSSSELLQVPHLKFKKTAGQNVNHEYKAWVKILRTCCVHTPISKMAANLFFCYSIYSSAYVK